MSFRTALVAALASSALTACGGLVASRAYASVGDHQTSTPKSRSEGGHTPPVVPPRGLSWSLDVAAFEDQSAGAASHFQMRVVIVDRATPPGTWRIAPIFEGAELVDDEGGRFPCTRALVPDLPDDEIDADEVPTRVFTYVFDVPSSYRFRRITALAVHWGLSVGGAEPLRVTTRFLIG